MLRALILCLGLLMATGVEARCTGTDLRTRLTPEGEALLAREIKKVPFAYGNHWIATKGTQRIHLIGTQHTGDSRMRAVMRRIAPVIEAADAVLLEVTGKQLSTLEETLRRNPSLMTIPKGAPGLDKLMAPEEWRFLVTRMNAQGDEEWVLSRLQPWFLSMNLARSGCGGRGLLAYRGLDDRIELLAARAGVPVGALEAVGSGMSALSSIPIRDQVKLLVMDMKSELNFDDQVVTLSNAYFDEELAEAMLIEDWTLYRDLDVSRKEVARLLRQFDVHILDKRNRAWIPVILRTKAQTLVVAVGAAHLPGKSGLLNLLKQRGYSLSRAEF